MDRARAGPLRLRPAGRVFAREGSAGTPRSGLCPRSRAMFSRSNPRWTRLPLVLALVLGLGATSRALAGNTHSEGGAVVEAPGVPETDGTAQVQIYWTGDSAA